MSFVTTSGRSWTPDLESTLVRALHHRDATALAAIYDAHARLVYSVACRILGNASDAEEIVQDVFVQIWRRPLRFDPARGSIRNWLVTIARTRSLDRRRRLETRRRFIHATHAIDEIAGSLPVQHSPVLIALEVRELRARFARLPAAQRRPLELALYEGFTHVEIADRLGIPLGTVKSRLRAALRQLREPQDTPPRRVRRVAYQDVV